MPAAIVELDPLDGRMPYVGVAATDGTFQIEGLSKQWYWIRVTSNFKTVSGYVAMTQDVSRKFLVFEGE